MNNDDQRNDSVYALVTELCKRFIDKHTPAQHPYLPHQDDSANLKRFRSRAFEILLNKTCSNIEEMSCVDSDPVVEILKHSFTLKNALGRHSRAKELERLLEEACADKDDLDEDVYGVLRFLDALKSLDAKEENTLDIFHYGRPNPLFPEVPESTVGQVPRYQIYPVEATLLPERFERTLGSFERSFRMLDERSAPRECLSFGDQLKSSTTIGIESLGSKSERTIRSIASAPRYTVRLVSTREFSMSPHFADDGTTVEDERLGFFPEIESATWLCVKSARNNDETNSELTRVRSETEIYEEETECPLERLRDVWDDVWKEDNRAKSTERRTWETLGRYDATKEASFVTETNEAMLHLERIKQAGFVFLLPMSAASSFNLVRQISRQRFMEDVKLLLLGVESDTFVWTDTVGFRLAANTTMAGSSAEAIRSACNEITHWGECYKSLRRLVSADPQTGKMQQEGLIFRAMCNSVDELLLYYQAVILRLTVNARERKRGLLDLLRNVRPVGSLMARVARLCCCDRDNDETLGEGLGILSHIYERVTEITETSVALVFYSILKSCCEVYFGLLQKWLFEGVCDDEFGEFMIKIRPRYARERSHAFWSKAFAINKNSVPGFIGNLAEAILECGKTVRLLKICDPKNPLTNIRESSHPIVRVCLSVGMVREQEFLCRDIIARGEKSLGTGVSFVAAFEDQRRNERERARLVVNAQRHTLERIKRERQRSKMEEARNKRELLAQLRDQAEEVASRKEREREEQLLLDEQILREANAAEEAAKNALLAKQRSTIERYEDLTAEAERRRIRADWRVRRMRLFNARTDSMERNERETEGTSVATTRVATTNAPINKSPRPCLLDIKIITRDYPNTNMNELIANKRDTSDSVIGDNATMTPNNNELDIILVDEQGNTLSIDPSTINSVNARKDDIQGQTHRRETTTISITEVEKNRRRNMAHSPYYGDSPDARTENIVFSVDRSELVRNRARIMGHDNDNYRDYTGDKTERKDDRNEVSTPIGQSGVTPMSCTTDTFQTSISDGRSNNCDDCFIPDGKEKESIPAGTTTTTTNILTPSVDTDLAEDDEESSRMSKNHFTMRNNAHWKFFGLEAAATPVFESSLTVDDVEMIDNTSLRVYLEKSVATPLAVQSHLANAAIVKHLIHDCHILSHLRSLRSYFFLLNGEFAKSLTNSLYSRLYEISSPMELFGTSTLTNFLEQAMNCSLSGSYDNSERLSLSAVDVPTQLRVSDPEFLNCICLNYKITWPLNIIIDDRILQQYSKVFKFLLMVGRVLYVLQRDFHILKVDGRATATSSPRYHQLQLYRHSMMQFITALHNYLTCSVLHQSWREFEKDLANATTVDQIYLTHVNYVKKILSRCMLTTRGEKMRTFLCNIFKVILKFHNRVRSQNVYSQRNFERLETMYRTFCDARTYLAHVAKKLASSGYQPHLTHFLNALNINPRYDLTDTSSSSART